mmetsp:Transcript_13499/g.30580  ORF Transcript_13499/g.30580 Transcript_13499/m.30580 type:complete len:423 (+) Transcript_13499:890-2158(+)
MLAGARLCDDALLAKAQSQQALADGVVDLVRASEGELFALQPDLRAARVFRQPLGEVHGRRPADVLLAHLRHLRLELRVGFGFGVGHGELAVRLDESLRDVTAAELAEVGAGEVLRRHRRTRRFAWRRGAKLPPLPWRVLLFLRRRLGGRGRHASAKGLECPRGVAPVGRVDRGDDRGADDDAVGDLGNLLHLFGRGDAKAHRQRQVRVLADPGDELGQVCGERRTRAGHSRQRDAIEEGAGALGQLLDAVVGGGRREQRDVREARRGAEVHKLLALLGRKVDDDEAVHAGGLAVVHQLLEPVREEWVVVPHQDDRHRQPLGACLLGHLEAVRQRDGLVAVERDLVRPLDGRPVGERVGERHAQLDDVSPAGLHRVHDRHCLGERGVPRGHKADKGGAAFGLRLRKRGHHLRRHGLAVSSLA